MFAPIIAPTLPLIARIIPIFHSINFDFIETITYEFKNIFEAKMVTELSINHLNNLINIEMNSCINKCVICIERSTIIMFIFFFMLRK